MLVKTVKSFSGVILKKNRRFLKKSIYQMIVDLINANRMLFFIVFLPIFVVTLYSLLIQSPRYQSYAVISIEKNQSGLPSLGIGSLLGGISGSDAAVPSEVAIDYINSLTMYEALDKQIGLNRMLKNHKIDLISRLKSHPDQKEILAYYSSLLSTFYNSQSQTIELKFQSYSPEDSQRVLGQIMLNIQDFVNNLDQQLTTQRVNFGKKQVSIAHKKLSEVEAGIITFQNNKNMFDPKTETGVIVSILATLQSQLVMAQTDLADKNAYYQPDSIEIQSIQQKIDTLKSQINTQKQKLLGYSAANASDLKLNQVLAEFEELSMQAKIAGAEYAASIQGLELAKADAIQQKQQVVIVQPPTLPDYAAYPRIWYNDLVMFLVLLMIYGIIKMFVRIVLDHRH